MPRFMHVSSAAALAVASIGAADSLALPDVNSLLLGFDDAISAQEDADPKSPWSWNLGLALNGSRTTTDSLSFRLSAGGRRQAGLEDLTLNAVYLLQYSDGVVSENNGLFDVEQVWKFAPDDPWNAWAQGAWQFNENEGYRTRLTGYAGIGYQVLDTVAITVNLKAGFGAQWDYRGDTTLHPQSILEVVSDWTIADGLKFTGSTSIANDLTDFASYLLRSRFQFEAAVKAIDGLALTIGVRDEYDSTPAAGSSYNQLWYWVGLQYNF
jgi:putative salt-induced outer membrane protein YdiY